MGLLFAHLLFYISSADGVTYSSIGMQATTHEPVQPESWREALIEPFSILPEARDFLSTWRLTKQKAAQFFFANTLLSKVNRSLKRCEASGSIRTRPHQKYEVTPLK